MTAAEARAWLEGLAEDEEVEGADVDEAFAGLYGRAADDRDGDTGNRLSFCYAALPTVFCVGDIVTGTTDDSETGEAGAVVGDQITVGWQSCSQTTQHASLLRRVPS